MQVIGSRAPQPGALSNTAPFPSRTARIACPVNGRRYKGRSNHLARSQQGDRDHPTGRPLFDDPHKTPPPHVPVPPSSSAFKSIHSSDLEFGNDAISGAILETPDQLAHQQDERLHQQDVAREAYQAREAAQGIARLVLEGIQEEERCCIAQRREAHQQLVVTESTAEEREKRYQGILQAMDSLGAQPVPPVPPPAGHSSSGPGPRQHAMRGASDSEGEELSPDGARLAAGSGTENEEQESFESLRHIVDELGEGERAAELIMKSYQGRNLESEAMGTIDPADHMPHPGDRYLPPRAVRVRQSPGGPLTARINQTHTRPHFERHRVLPLPPARGAGGSEGRQLVAAPAAGDWIPAGDNLSEAPRAPHDPVGEEEGREGHSAVPQGSGVLPGDDQAEVGGEDGASGSPPETNDDQIDYEQDAMRGADALYYSDNPAVNDYPTAASGGVAGSGGNIDAPETYDVEGDALRGGDAMFYFKTSNTGGGGDVEEEHRIREGLVWGALQSRDEEHSAFRRVMEESSGKAGPDPDQAAISAPASQTGSTGQRYLNSGANGRTRFKELHERAFQQRQGRKKENSKAKEKPEGILASLRRRRAERQANDARMQVLAIRLKEARSPPPMPRPAGFGRVVEVAVGRAAAIGLGSAFFSELLTQQSVMSQLLGRFEGPRQIESAIALCRGLAVAVLLGSLLFTLAERITSSGDACPRWHPLGLSPVAQVWLGRAAMALFVLLLAYEAVHSNRPAFGTFFYLWF